MGCGRGSIGIRNWELGIGNWELGIGKILRCYANCQEFFFLSRSQVVPGNVEHDHKSYPMVITKWHADYTDQADFRGFNNYFFIRIYP